MSCVHICTHTHTYMIVHQGAMANMFYHPGKHYGMRAWINPDILLYTQLP